MSRTVLLFRHGKSDWNASYDRDHNRPLNARGKRASTVMGRWLARTGPLPDLILCSTAVRARSTCEIAKDSGGWSAEIQYEQGLYHANPNDLIHYLQEISDAFGVVMLVGHQPTWSMTAGLLSNSSVTEFPTASMARIDLPIETWDHCVSGAGKLIWHQFPKQLPENNYKSNQ